MNKAPQYEEKSRLRKADSISSVLHTAALDCLFCLLITTAVVGYIWLVEVLA